MIKTNNANVMVGRQKTIAALLSIPSKIWVISVLASSLFVCQSIYLTIGTTDWSQTLYVRVVLNIESLQKDHGETWEGQEESLRLRLFSDLEVQVGQLETWNQTQTSDNWNDNKQEYLCILSCGTHWCLVFLTFEMKIFKISTSVSSLYCGCFFYPILKINTS